MAASSTITFETSARFRQRIALSILSGRPCRFDNIRSLDDKPGLRDYEVSFLRLMDKITNGTKIEINVSGTRVTFIPGAIAGGRLNHDCGNTRAIGYFLEMVVWLAPFAKKPLHLTLTGITNDEADPGVDVMRTVTLPLLRKFGIEDGLELKITKRGAAPGGGGEVVFACPVVRTLRAVRMEDVGMVKRIRGIAYSMRVAATTANRVVDAGRGLLNAILPDVYIYTDHYKGAEAGRSPGFGLTLVAETTTGVLLSGDAVAAAGEMAEDLGTRAAGLVLDEVQRGGCVDTQHQHTVAVLMALCPQDVSKVRVGVLSPFAIEVLRDIRAFLGVTFKVTAEPDTSTVLLACVGSGYVNLNKKLA